MATTKQTQMIAGRMVEFQDRFEKLPNDDSQWIIQNTGEAIDLFIAAVINRTKSSEEAATAILSEIISTVTIPTTAENFVTKDKFQVNTSRKAKVKILHLGDNFKSWFMGKTEEHFSHSTVYGRMLNKGSVDGPILSGLGGQEKSETTLYEIYTMMEHQPNGEAGKLLNNGNANIFYVRDITGTLRCARVSWSNGGWLVMALSIELLSEWGAGVMVFSRNYLLPQAV